MGSIARVCGKTIWDRGDRHLERRTPRRYFHHITRVRKSWRAYPPDPHPRYKCFPENQRSRQVGCCKRPPVFTTDGGRPVVVGTSTSWPTSKSATNRLPAPSRAKPLGAERVMVPVETGVSCAPAQTCSRIDYTGRDCRRRRPSYSAPISLQLEDSADRSRSSSR